MASRKGDLLRRVEKAPLIGRRSAVIYSLALVLVALAGACSAASDVASDAANLESRVSLHLEQTYGADTAPREAIIGSIQGITLGRRGSVYILDDRPSRLIAFNADGTVAWVAGGPGRGPGDLSQATGVVFDGASTLYVGNRDSTYVDTWDINGRYVATHSVRSLLDRYSAQVLGFIGSSYLVLFDSLRGKFGSSFFVVNVGNDDWEVIFQFEVVGGPKELPEYTNLRHVPLVGFGTNAILVGNHGIYEAKVYDTAGSLLRVFSRELHTLEMPRRADTPPTIAGGFQSRGWDLGGVSPPIPLEGDYWMTQASWPQEGTNVGKMVRDWLAEPSDDFQPIRMMNAVDVFDSSGDLVSSTVTEGRGPAEGIFFAVGTDRRLYATVHEPFPQVRRYRVEIGR